MLKVEDNYCGCYTVYDTDTPKIRYQVRQDEWEENPLDDYSNEIDYYVVGAGYDSLYDEPTGQLSIAFAHFNDKHEDAIEVMRRYLVIFHGWTVDQAESNCILYFGSGYIQSDWFELFLISDNFEYTNLHAYGDMFDQWVRGDVYSVTVENLVECDSAECHGDIESHWVESEDAYPLKGIYTDSVEGAVNVYKGSI